MSSNLPPGVTEGMIPGNRPQDIAAEQIAESIDETDVVEALIDAEVDLGGFVAFEGARGDGQSDAWWVELPEIHPYDKLPRHPDSGRAEAGPFDSLDEAISYIAAEGEDQITDAIVQERLDDEAEYEPDEPDWDSMPGGADDY